MRKITKKDWDTAYEGNIVYSPVSELLLDELNLKGSILDVGCGRGQLLEQLKNRGLTVRGIDLSDYSADMVGDFLKYKLGKYDVIITNKVLAFNPIEAFLKRVKDHLKPGGTFVLITPIRYSEYADKYDEHYESISVDYDELKIALRNVFDEVELVHISYFNYYGAEAVFSMRV